MCGNFILPETGKPCLLFYALFNLRNLLYLIIGNGTYGNVRIQINGEPYEIQNQQSVVLMNGESTDLSAFSIKKATGKFEPICGDQPSVNVIEDTVKDICIIQDLGVLPSGEEIRMDMAVVFKTGLTTTMFSRDA